MSATDPSDLHRRVLGWYRVSARSLPWRDANATAWGVLVSEIMLQQTPVSRVLPVWESWMRSWPKPRDLAAAAAGEAVRAWQRLGYPRRALRLHEAATVIVSRHRGEVPRALADLRALPGVGEYTAAAVASFAFGQRHVVLDTNVRRVLARAFSGVELPPAAVTRAEREVAASVLPQDAETAATWAVAVMELGALVCTASAPKCGMCPLQSDCSWRRLGYPAYDGPPRRGQTYAGTDRQCRGRLLAALRDHPAAVDRARLDLTWAEPEQRERCLHSLVADGLVVLLPTGDYALP